MKIRNCYVPIGKPFIFLSLSGAHFSAAPTPDMKVSIRVFGVADYESKVRFSKFNMAESNANKGDR